MERYINYPTLELRIDEFCLPDRTYYSVSIRNEDIGRFDSKEELMNFIEGLLQGKRLMMPATLVTREQSKS